MLGLVFFVVDAFSLEIDVSGDLDVLLRVFMVVGMSSVFLLRLFLLVGLLLSFG